MLEVYRPRTYIKVHIYLLLIVLFREFIIQVVSGGVLGVPGGVLGVPGGVIGVPGGVIGVPRGSPGGFIRPEGVPGWSFGVLW